MLKRHRDRYLVGKSQGNGDKVLYFTMGTAVNRLISPRPPALQRIYARDLELTLLILVRDSVPALVVLRRIDSGLGQYTPQTPLPFTILSRDRITIRLLATLLHLETHYQSRTQ